MTVDKTGRLNRPARRRNSISRIRLAILVCLFLLPGTLWGVDEKWQELDKGEVLITEIPVTGQDGVTRLRGQAVALIDAPPARVWNTITDHNHFAEFMPSVKECRIVEDSGRSRLVSYRLKVLWKDIYYHLRVTTDIERLSMESSLEKSFPHNINEIQASWHLESVANGNRTKVIYSVYLDSGSHIPKSIEHFLSRNQLPQVLSNTRKRVMSGGVWTQP